MPTENRIDCPALHKRSNSCPFGERVPRTVRMLKTVAANPMPGIGFAYIKGDVPVAQTGRCRATGGRGITHSNDTAAIHSARRISIWLSSSIRTWYIRSTINCFTR